MITKVICNECKSKGTIYIHQAFWNQKGIVGYNLTDRLNKSLIMAMVINECKYHNEEEK